MTSSRAVVALAALSLIAGAVLALRTSNDTILVEVDDEGYFASAEPVEATGVFPGDGVRMIFQDAANGDVTGRLAADPPEEPAIWTRDDGGTLSPRLLRTRPASGGLRSRVEESLTGSLGDPPATATPGAFDLACRGKNRRAFPAPGAASRESSADPRRVLRDDRHVRPLAAFVPRGWLFVRFRSVEAAYRFVSEADRLAGALLAATAQDGRDEGTLRWTLHDLLLPTIWRTNPDAERGVGEVGLVVAPPFVRGRLRAALLLRITDAELHRMQTQAGIAQENAPDHAWRPADDPVPQERTRRNFRRIAWHDPDVEIVATDAPMLEVLAKRGSDAVEMSDPYHAFESATSGQFPTDQAALACMPFGDVTSASDVQAFTRDLSQDPREDVGLGFLARKWFGNGDGAGPGLAAGAVASMGDPPDGHRTGPGALLWALRSVTVNTDPRGAAIVATARNAASAQRFAQALRDLPAGGPSADRACLRNLADLVPLALVENPQEDVAERNFVVLGWKPLCPCGGTYSVHPVTREVSCSVHGTVKAPRPGTWKPPPVSDVKAEGNELSFRLAIDWNRKE